jgi:lipoprotein-anchoring transpeptidase ErfK/SrfK
MIITGTALIMGYGVVIWVMPKHVQARAPTSIIINVVQRKLYLYRSHKLFHVYPVAVGKSATPSPRGEFVITQKAIWGMGLVRAG